MYIFCSSLPIICYNSYETGKKVLAAMRRQRKRKQIDSLQGKEGEFVI